MIYPIVYAGIVVAALPHILWLLVTRPAYRRRLAERLGHYEGVLPGCIWIHAVSAGEVMVANVLAESLVDAGWAGGIALTTVTPEGRDLADLPGAAPAHYGPLDFSCCVGRAFEAIRPRALILIELEIWPRLLMEAAERGVPVFIANGRLPETDARSYRWVRRILRPIFGIPARVFAQGEDDAHRFQTLGIRPERLEVLGSLKPDAALRSVAALPGGALVQSRYNDITRSLSDIYTASEKSHGGSIPAACQNVPCILGASTHAGEEKMLLIAFGEVRRSHPRHRLILAPRDPDRARSVILLAIALGWRVRMIPPGQTVEGPGDTPGWTPTGESDPGGDWDVGVINQVGHMPEWYHRASAAFIGKSFRVGGGQNFLEAVVAGCPAVWGPLMGNFEPLATQFVEAGAALRAANPAALAVALCELCGPCGAQVAARARALLASHTGKARLTANRIIADPSFVRKAG